MPSFGDVVAPDGTLKRLVDQVDEDISQFAVDNNFQADFQTGALSHTVLLGLDHQRTNTNYKWLEGNAPDSNVIQPDPWRRFRQRRVQHVLRLQPEDQPDRPLRPGPDRPGQMAPDIRRS